MILYIKKGKHSAISTMRVVIISFLLIISMVLVDGMIAGGGGVWRGKRYVKTQLQVRTITFHQEFESSLLPNSWFYLNCMLLFCC